MNKINLQGSSFFVIQEDDASSEYLLLQYVSTESRRLSAINTAQVNSTHVQPVTLVKLEFDTPAYVHSGVGTITYDSNDYLGVGGYGTIGAARESEELGPLSISLTLSGIDTDYIAEALDSGNIYDVVTVYQGYRQDDGTLYDDPWVVWRGWYEFGSIEMGEESSISITCQHDLSILNEKLGSRYSEEDQEKNYPGDLGLEFTADMAAVQLNWGGGPVRGGRFDNLPPGNNQEQL